MAHRIDHPTAQAGQFTEGNPGTGQPATVVTDDWLNNVQEEICTLVEAEGITLDKTKVDQIRQALSRRAAGRSIGFRNKFANGHFAIWQRFGTSKDITSANGSIYVADRWRSLCGSSAGGATISQQTHPNGAPGLSGEAGLRYLRHAQTSGSGGTQPSLEQRVIEFEQLDARTVTFSAWLKVASGTANIIARLAQKYDNAGVGDTQFEATWAVTTTWTKFSFTQALGSNVGKTIGTFPYVSAMLVMPGAATFTLDVALPQLEVGDVATEFEVRPPVLELTICEFFYQKTYPIDVAPGTASEFRGALFSAADAFQVPTDVEGLLLRFNRSMRVVPTLIWYSPNSGASGKVEAQLVAGTFSDVNVFATNFANKSSSGYPTLANAPANGTAARAHLTADAEI